MHLLDIVQHQQAWNIAAFLISLSGFDAIFFNFFFYPLRMDHRNMDISCGAVILSLLQDDKSNGVRGEVEVPR